MKDNLMNQNVKWEEFASLTDREISQLAINNTCAYVCSWRNRMNF